MLGFVNAHFRTYHIGCNGRAKCRQTATISLQMNFEIPIDKLCGIISYRFEYNQIVLYRRQWAG